MQSMKKILAMRGMKILNVIMVAMLFLVCWESYYGQQMDVGQNFSYTVAVGTLYIMLYVLLGRTYNAFSAGMNRISHLMYSQGLTVLAVNVFFYVIMTVATLRFTNPVPMLGLMVAQGAWSLLWCFLANRLYLATNPPKKTVVVYCCEKELQKMMELKHFARKFQVVKYVKVLEKGQNILEDIAGTEAVFISGLDMERRNTVLKYCIKQDIQCFIQPRVGDIILSGAKHAQAFSVPFMRIEKVCLTPEYLFIKRFLDIVLSLLAIIVAMPFMVITALAIKLYDGGPVLYKQVRLTKDYKVFKVLKFRSMRTDAEKDGIARLSTANDDRITPVGKIIRKIRFDELPQLFNILKGDMTIVGPRPERPEIASQYEKEIPSFGMRLQVKAGLTGYAQIYGRYNTEPYDKLKMDLMYINNMSVVEDLRLMLATVKILFMPESTEGIEDGKITASSKETAEKEMQSV